MKIKEISINDAYDIHRSIPEFIGPNFFSKSKIENTLKKKKALILGGYFNGKLAGYLIGYEETPDDLFYSWIGAVSPRYRVKGIYKKMREYQEEWAKTQGYKRIRVKTWNVRIPMRITLAKMNYNIVGFEEKDNVLENRLMHEKTLN